MLARVIDFKNTLQHAATPVWIGGLLMALALARLLFWSEAIIQVNSTLISVFCVPAGVAVLTVLAAKKHRPGPAWQHSHWVFLRRTMIGNAVGGVIATLLMAPVLLHVPLDLHQVVWGFVSLAVTTAWVLLRCLQAIRAAEQLKAVIAPKRYGL